MKGGNFRLKEQEKQREEKHDSRGYTGIVPKA